MLINPEKMVLVYTGVKFDKFEFERGYETGTFSRVSFFAPICGGCITVHGMTKEERTPMKEDVDVSCGVLGCPHSADFFIEFNFGFEESDVEEKYEEYIDPMEYVYEAELNFD